jgi:cysteine desulfurase
MRPPTYLDYASLAPPVPEALDAIRAAAEQSWGQPGSLHAIGGRALYALDTARRRVADYLGTTWQEVVFTASGREALAVAMAQALASVAKGAVLVASRQDHPAMLGLVEAAAVDGYDVRWLAMPGGVPSADDWREIEGASVVALSACNHELGTSLLDVLAKVPVSAVRVVDAVQVAPWLSLSSLNDDRTFYAISGAKLGAPLGVGAARVPSKTFYAARQSGTALETESPPWLMAIALGAACDVRASQREEHLALARRRADELLAGLRDVAPGLVVNGSLEARLGPILNVSFPDQYGKSLAAALSLQGVCISHTAACQARRSEVSPVVRAAYPDEPARAAGATRWSVSERVTSEDISFAVEAVKRLLTPRKNAAE